jgi:predicted nucleic acid-binding protein
VGDELATTVPVIAESSWLILDRLGPEAQARFLDLVISRTLDLVDLTHQDWERVAALCRQYADLRLDATDVSLIAVAERMRLGSIASYNHRDFLVVRPEHVATFELLP